MRFKEVRAEKDLIITGGGIAGIVNAIQSARLGLKVALINNRGYFGGNASAEIGINVSGATGTQEFNYFARETGVIEELIIENMHRNPEGNRYIWDSVVMDTLLAEKNIELFANTNIDEVRVENGRIISISGSQLATCRRYEFFAPLFADNTGDGTVGYLAGANYRYGREGRNEFNERIAPELPDEHVLPSTLVFVGKNTGKPVKYIPPKFALDLTKTDILQYRIIPKKGFESFQWFYEIDGDKDQIRDAEEIIRHHRSLVYGIWDYIKNSGNYDSENYTLEYVASVPGKRESRRLMGDYILTEGDIIRQRDFEDAVGHGGWSIDLHAIQGFYAREPINRHVFLKGVYQIPYRCGYSNNIVNLFIEGRCMSTSHVAFGTTRVMATLATIGQANAVAAYLCLKHKTNPREIYEGHLEELQRLLLKNDQYIIGKEYVDPGNLVQNSKVSVSSEHELKVVNADSHEPLEHTISISIPVIKKLDAMRVLLRNAEGTSLKYSAFKPTKHENYNPAEKLFEGEIALPACEEFRWVELPFKLEIKEAANIFISLEANEKIEFSYSVEGLTGVICSKKYPTNEINYIDVDTLECKNEIWKRMDNTLCFEITTGENVFGGYNLTNGYARPYKGTNIWQSKEVDNEFFTVEFDSDKNLSEIVLIFDTNLDKYYTSFWPMPYSEAPGVVKSYEIYYKDRSGKFIKLTEVRDNYQRINRIGTRKVITSEIKVVFKETNGQNHIGVYSVRVYGENSETP